MARICGICPVSHLIASAKACDALLAVSIPPTADKLRRIFGLAQVVAVARAELLPSLLAGPAARHGRRSGQEQIFGVPKKIPSWRATASACASSASRSLNAWAASAFTRLGSFPAASASPYRRTIATPFSPRIPEALAIAERTLEWFKSTMERSARKFHLRQFPHACSWAS